MTRMKQFLLVLALMSASAGAKATICEDLFKTANQPIDQTKTAKAFDEITLASAWAETVFAGKDSAADEARIRETSKRLIPFGRTFVRDDGTSVRRVSQIFQIARNSDRMIFLQARKDSIQLLIGAPVSKETMAAAVRNSAYLIMQPPNPEPRFSALFKFIISASDAMKDVHKIDAYAQGQDPFNREVAPIGDFALVPIDLNKSLTREQLADFLLILWMATDGSL